MNKPQKSISKDVKELWHNNHELDSAILSALESIGNEPAPESLKRKIQKADFSKTQKAQSERKFPFLKAAFPAAALAVLILCLVPMRGGLPGEYSTPGSKSSNPLQASQNSVDTELVLALFESDLAETTFVFDVFAGGFLSLEDSA